MESSNTQTCGNCHFFRSHASERQEEFCGQCRRFPPTQPNEDLTAGGCYHRLVNEENWCGEWKEQVAGVVYYEDDLGFDGLDHGDPLPEETPK